MNTPQEPAVAQAAIVTGRVRTRRIALTLTVAMLGAAVCGAAAAGATSNTTHASRAATTYASKRYGYEIALRGRYTMIQALLQWDGSFPFGASGMVDITIDPQDRKFIVAAKPVSSRMTLARWQAYVVGVKKENCTRLRDFRSTSIGGVLAREFVNSCPGYEVITLVALHHRRGYLFEYLSPTGSNADSAHRTYEAGRRSFEFAGP